MSTKFLAIPRLALTSVSLIALCGVSAQAYAQEGADKSVDVSSAAAADSATSSNEILVTATLREQTLQEVPVAVTVLSGDALDSAGVGNVNQLTEVAPSLTFSKGNNENNSSLNIRGIGTSVFSAAVEPAVSVIVDGVALARSGQGFQDFIDVQRVEVLRGPQSTLFGKNASAGVVSVTTLAPTDYLSGKFDAMYAEGDEYFIRGTLSGPLAPDLALRVTGFYKKYQGMTTNLYNGEHLNGYKSYGGKARLQFETGGGSKITLMGDVRKYEAKPTFVVTSVNNPSVVAVMAPLVAGTDNRDVNVSGDIFSHSPQWGASLTGEFNLGNDFKLTTISGFRDWKFDNNIDVDMTSLANPLTGILTWDVNHGDNHLKQYSQELRLESPDLGGFDFLVGGFAYKLDYDTSFDRRWETIVGPNQVNRSGQFTGGVKTTNLAIFGSGNVYVGPVTLFGGIRLLHEKLEWSVFRDPADVLVPGDVPFNGSAGTAADFSDSTSDTAFVGNAGASFEISNNANLYASYSRGYKGKGFNVAFASIEGSQPVDAEKSDAFEAGLKLSTPDRVFSLNLAAFYTKYKNYQAQARRAGEITFELINAGSISTKGVEAEATLKPTGLLTINLGATLLDAKIVNLPSGPCYDGQTAAEGCVGGAQDLAGAPLSNAPDFRATGLVRQGIPLGDALPFDAYVQANFTYQSKVQYSINQDPRTIQGGYGLVHAAVGLDSKDGGYSLQVFVRNLFDVHRPAALQTSTTNGGYTAI